MKSNFIILATTILITFGCTTAEKKEFPPFTINITSEDSTIITVTYDEFIKTFNDTKRYNEVLSRKPLTQTEIDEYYSQAFHYIVNKKKLLHETEYLGIKITQEEVNDFIYGQNIDEKISTMPVFRNPKTQEFDKTLIKPFIENLSKNKDSEPYFIWDQHINSIKETKLREKYEALLHASYVKTDVLDNWHNKLSVGESTLKLFSVPYSLYYDSIDPTDEDYLEFLEKISYNYQVSDKRYIRVASIPAKIHKHFHEREFNALSRYIETVKDFNEISKQNDFIKIFSSYYTENTIPQELTGFFKNGKKGDIHGPYFKNNSFRAIKINTIDNLPTQAKAQHLVINNISKEIALSIKKDIEGQIKKGNSFINQAKIYAEKYGDDGKWGDLDWFTYGEMVDDFSDSVFMNKPGDIVLAQSQYGYHIIKVLDHKNISKKYNFTSLYWPLHPVEEDIEATIQESKDFIGNLKDHTEFESVASEKGYQMEDYEGFAYTNKFRDFENSYEIHEWAYNTFENDIKTFRMDDKIYAIKLFKIAPPGLMPIFDARQYVRNGLFNSEVKEYFQKTLNAEKINSMSIDEAASHFKSSVYIVKDIKFTNVAAPKVGTEPFIVGMMTAAKPGERSGIIYGNQRFIIFEKKSENNKQITTLVGKNKMKEWHTNIDNSRYMNVLSMNERLAINIARKQNSYFVMPKYEDQLQNNLAIAKKMFPAENAFKSKNYKEALYGNNNFKGFESMISESISSKQDRLILLYAGLSALQIGEYQKAINYLNRFESKDQFFSIIKYGAIGDAYSQLNNFEKALEFYQKAENSSNNFVVVPEYLIRSTAIYDKMGNYNKALEKYKLLKTKYEPSIHNYEADKYIAHYEYLTNKSKFIINN